MYCCIASSADVPFPAKYSAGSFAAQLATSSRVASGWNCTPTLRPENRTMLEGLPRTLRLPTLLGGAIGLWEDHPVLRLAVLFGVAGVTLAVYGMPRLWNLLVCAAIAITVGLRLQRAAQDEADLERL